MFIKMCRWGNLLTRASGAKITTCSLANFADPCVPSFKDMSLKAISDKAATLLWAPSLRQCLTLYELPHCCSLSESQVAPQGQGIWRGHDIWQGTKSKGEQFSLRQNMPVGPGLAPPCIKEASVAVPGLCRAASIGSRHNWQMGTEGHRLVVCESLYFQDTPVCDQQFLL